MAATVGIRDVARAAGVSVGTVSNVLNHPDQVSEKTLARVRGVMDRLGFVRNDLARQLRMGRGTAIGLVVVNVANPFFAALAHELEAAAEESGLTVVVGSSDQDAAREQRYIELFAEQRVRGLLLVPQHGVTPRLSTFRANGTPAILFDANVDSDQICSVGLDGGAGGFIAAQHLLDQGRRRLAVVGGPIAQIGDRVAGASRAVQESPDATLAIMETPDLTVEDGRAMGRRILALPKDERPDGVFAANDLVAIGLVEALILDGTLSIPDDVAIVGYDDIDFAASTAVPITSVHQPTELLARAALTLLEEELSGNETHVHGRHLFEPKLVVRASTVGGPAQAGRATRAGVPEAAEA